MEFGYFGINFGPLADPEAMLRVARAAEAAGLDSVWTGEHVVLPDPQVPPSPAPPQTPMLDPSVALAHVAAATETLLLGTGIIILPQRNPVELAKELASLDVVSKGRLLFGLGAGYLEPEFRALGANFEERGAVTDESIDVLRALWTQEQPHFEGRFFRFGGIDAQPRPVQRPHPPIVVGGMSRLAARRAAARGNGWYGFFTDPETTAKSLGWIREAVEQGLRPPELGELEISVTPPPPVTPELVKRYAELGVHRIIGLTSARDVDGALAFVEELAQLRS
ncbi:MAG: LLM class flavin-dependent oxidoreductase [Myxococcota bacterium]|nr:LLM class flavin-dependent oxidoreductase [Myxococcota bacterium]